MSLHIELIGRSILVKLEDINVVFTAVELIELTQWAIDHEMELRVKALDATYQQDKEGSTQYGRI